MRLKYIIFDDLTPVIFSETLGHNDVSVRPTVSEGKPTSAGEVSFYTEDG